MCIYVKRVERKGQNGDRATVDTPYFDYEIYMNSQHIDTVSGYDTWWSSVKPQKATEQAALALARKLARAAGGRVWRNF